VLLGKVVFWPINCRPVFGSCHRSGFSKLYRTLVSSVCLQYRRYISAGRYPQRLWRDNPAVRFCPCSHFAWHCSQHRRSLSDLRPSVHGALSRLCGPAARVHRHKPQVISMEGSLCFWPGKGSARAPMASVSCRNWSSHETPP
jgi:hypothetical protein